MKKVLLSLTMLAGMTLGLSQTVYFEEDFDELTEIPLDWTNVDADGDGQSWYVAQIVDDAGNPVYTPLLRSASWSSSTGALTPDNWIITPAIDLSGAEDGETIELQYNVNAADENWDEENYTVYVATSSDPADFLASSISFNEPTLDGFNDFAADSKRTIDVSALAGETIYVAFRHHDVVDQFTMELDNIRVATGNLGVSEITSNTKNLFVASVGNGEYKLQLPTNFVAEQTELAIYNTVGAKVVTTKYNEFVNLNNLPTGIYIIQATDGNNTVSKRFVKK